MYTLAPATTARVSARRAASRQNHHSLLLPVLARVHAVEVEPRRRERSAAGAPIPHDVMLSRRVEATCQRAHLSTEQVVDLEPYLALYRQGEALLKLGPNFGKAAEKAFDRVVKEYPDSRRAEDARQQLKLLGAG